MKKSSLLFLMLIISMTMIAQNPFFETSKNLHGAFQFDKLKNEHFMPAVEEGIKRHNAEVEAIVNNPKPATFENTIVALENSGRLYNHVLTIFFGLNSAETNDEMQDIAMKLSPILTKHAMEISMNEKLFARVKAVYEQRDKLKLNTEQMRLLTETYRSFAEGGADLPKDKKAQYEKLAERLSNATTMFGQNALNEVNNWTMYVEPERLKGVPEDLINTFRENADKAKREGFCQLTLRPTCYVPVMRYCEDRTLRRDLWIAFNSQCIQGSKFDNTENIREIVNCRLEIARIFGYKNYAEYSLRDKMAEKPENVYKLLNQLTEAYMPVAKQELAELQACAYNAGANFTLMPWDMSFYGNILKTKKFNVNDEITKPYFELENVKRGVFSLATRLYGLHFKKVNIPVYHKDVEGWEVTDAKGKYVALLYTDFHPRAGKRAGAWMTEYKGQWKDGKKDSRPHITIVMNFTEPTKDKPALLTFDEVETFLHEFGHAIHGMVTECTYPSLSGTNVARDFVELPSQFNENYAIEKEFLDTWAVHYQTGEKIPAELIQKLVDAANFNCGIGCLGQVCFGTQDMAFHTMTEPFKGDPLEVERISTERCTVTPQIPGTGRCESFTHIFSGGYAAGYYSYKWAEVLDADAFAFFKQNGIFDKATATSFLNNVLKRGNTEPAMTLYKRFRGQEPTIDALLRRNGIKK